MYASEGCTIAEAELTSQKEKGKTTPHNKRCRTNTEQPHARAGYDQCKLVNYASWNFGEQ